MCKIEKEILRKERDYETFLWTSEGMEAPCHPGYPIYTQSDLVFMGLIKNICSVERMRQKEERFNEKTCIDTLRLLPGHAGLEEMPY